MYILGSRHQSFLMSICMLGISLQAAKCWCHMPQTVVSAMSPKWCWHMLEEWSYMVLLQCFTVLAILYILHIYHIPLFEQKSMKTLLIRWSNWASCITSIFPDFEPREAKKFQATEGSVLPVLSLCLTSRLEKLLGATSPWDQTEEILGVFKKL